MSVSKIQKQTSISESEKYDFAQTHQDYQMNGQPSSIDDPEENDLPNEAGEPETEKDTLPYFVVESVKFDLTDAEILERSYRRRHFEKLLENEIEEFGQKKATHQASLKEINREIQILGGVIDTKTEYRNEQCLLEYDFQNETIITRRPDNGEIISKRGMTKDERQKRLFGGE